MKAQSKKIKNLTTWMALILITIIISVSGYFKTQEINQIANLPLELRKALEYGELQEEDYKTQSNNVEFSAFFTKDIYNDENAGKVKGKALQIGYHDTLYAELKVSAEGYLKNGKITLNANNMSWTTNIVSDNIVAKNYINQNVHEVELQEKVYAGSQKLFMGQISEAIGSNINNYSKVNSMTLTGTYVDGQGNETEINVTREFTVDWYGSVSTNIVSDPQDLNVSLSDNEMQLTFKVINKETCKQLLLKENVVQISAPKLNGYKATKALVSGGGDFTFDAETGVITITKEAMVGDNGYVQKYLSTMNTYNVTLIYPKEAHGDDSASEELFTRIEVPVTATYRGYNNQREEFINIVESTDTETLILVEEKGYIAYDKDALNITIGKKSGSKYIVSKERAAKAYNGNEIEDENYDVTWYYSHGSRSTNGKITMKETKPDEGITNTANNFNIAQFVTIDGIYFRTTKGRVGNISVYNDETNELIHTFEPTEHYSESNPYKFEDEVKKVRVEVSKADYGTLLEVHQIKRINNESLINQVAKEDFNLVRGIYSYLTALGENYSGSSKYSAYAQYSEEESEVYMSLSTSEIETQDLSFNETITISTIDGEYNQRKWKDASFLIQFPKDIVYAEIFDVTTNNENVKILGYDLYKENGNYFAKIITQNDEPTTYNLYIETNEYINPIATTQTQRFNLYAYNKDCYAYTNSITDIYDINDNNDTNDTVGTYSCPIHIIAPELLLTSQTASNYDGDLNIVIAPSTADVRKDNRTTDINVNIFNNYRNIVSDTKILGTIPYEGNTFISSGIDLGSEYTVEMVDTGVQIPNELYGKVKIYYTENEQANSDLEKEENGWTQIPSDWTKVRRFLIDFGNNNISSGKQYTFTYKITLPEGLEYNKIAYSEHEVSCSLNTTDGKLPIQLEPSKLGIRIARKYNIDITKLNKENGRIVPGAVYKLTEYNKNNEQISSKIITTNSAGKLIAKGLYVDSIYTLEEIKTPDNYMLNKDVLKFITRENEEGNLDVEVLSEAKFKINPTITEDTMVSQIEEDPRYKVVITKIDSATKEPIKDVVFKLEETGERYTTNTNGQITLNSLDQYKEYTLKEVYADGYYLLEDIKFTVVKENGQFKINSNNEAFANATVEKLDNEDLLFVTLELEDERQPQLLINKIDKETGNAIEGVRFTVDGRVGKVYVTDSNGQTLINGFEENKEYTLREIKAKGYYLQEVTFKVVRDENDVLKVESQNPDFANATVTDGARKILTVNMKNDPIPSYDLEIIKLSEGTKDSVLQGAKFNLISEDDDSVKEYVTDENGKITVKDLYAYVEGKDITGNYILQETEAPNGYSNNAEKIKFKVIKTEDGYDIQVQNEDNLKTLANKNFENGKLTLTIEDKPLFTLTKIDQETGEPLANVGFVIMELSVPTTYAKDINGNYIGEQNADGQYIVRTNENGKVALPLRNGKYALIEVEYPEGYEKTEVMKVFEVRKGDMGQEAQRVLEIRKIEDLVELSKQVNNGDSYEGVTVNLINSIDFNNDNDYNDPLGITYGDLNNDGHVDGIKEELTKEEGKGFPSIGSDELNAFSGIFDGNGNEISNIHINNNVYGETVGLFAYINKAEIKNLGLTGKININYGKAGGLVASSKNSKIEKCYNKSDVSCSGNAAGIVGTSSNDIIKNCYNTGNIESTYGSAAGIVTTGNPLSCYNIGNVKASEEALDENKVGAISLQEAYNCYYLDNITISGYKTINAGTSKTFEYMKTQDFINELDKYNFVLDTENINNGYPVFGENANYENGLIERIEKIEDLVEFSKQVNTGNTYEGHTVKLINNLDFTDDESYRNPEDQSFGDINKDGTVDGIKTELTKEAGEGFRTIAENDISEFKGKFDGNEKEIKNLYINKSTGYVGFFGNTNGATIENLTIDGEIKANPTESDTVNITTSTQVNGKTINKEFRVGGLIAKSNNSQINNVVGKININVINNNTINVKYKGTGYRYSSGRYYYYQYDYSFGKVLYISGFIGEGNNTKISNSINEGNIELGGTNRFTGNQVSNGALSMSAHTTCYLGGLTGDSTNVDVDGFINKGNIHTQTYSYETRSGSGNEFRTSTNIVINEIKGNTIINSGNEGNVTIDYNVSDNFRSNNSYTYIDDPDVSICGIKGSFINGCYNSGNLTSNNGDIAGISANRIENCYNTGNITNTTGKVSHYNSSITLNGISGDTTINCYNTGDIIGTSTGSEINIITSSRNSYYLDGIQLVGENVNTEGVISKSSDEMKTQEFVETLNPTAFKQDTQNINNGYPILNKVTIDKKVQEINCIQDLVDLSADVNSGNYYKEIEILLLRTIDFNEDESYKDNNPNDTSYGDLNGDGNIEGIKAELTSGIGFTPINSDKPIKFNGNGNEIRNLYINKSSSMVGLFGNVKEITIENLGISGNIIGSSNTAAFIGYSSSSPTINLINCYNKANITATNGNAGGLIGYVSDWGESESLTETNIINCYNLGNITSNNNGQAGGLAGYISCDKIKIEDSYNKGNINCSYSDVGGLAGTLYGSSIGEISIKNCYNEADIGIQTAGNYRGGLIGNIGASRKTYIENCYNTGKVIGDSYFGGIVGTEYSTILNIKDCENTGNVISSSSRVGGLIGYKSGTINASNCHNTGDITQTGTDAYGSIGGLFGEISGGNIENCYNTGNIIAVTYKIGGLVGDAGGSGTSYDTNLNNCYNLGDIYRDSDRNGDYIGGLVGGYNSSNNIENCYNAGNITASGYNISGISTIGKVTKCYNTGDIIAKKAQYVAGIVVNSYEGSSQNYNTGNITVTDTSSIYVGGITANYGCIDCFNTGNITCISNGSVFAGGISGGYNGKVENCYNTGNIIVQTNDSSSSSIYVGGIAGNSENIRNCYNTGNIDLKVDNAALSLGGISGNYNSTAVENVYNSGNIKLSGENTQSNSNCYIKIGGIAPKVSDDSSYAYNLGNIEAEINDINTVNIGRITAESNEGNETTNMYYADNMKFNIYSNRGYTAVNNGEIPIDRQIVPDLYSEEFYNTINGNGVWTRIEGFAPKLLVNTASQTEATEVKVENKSQKFDVTTDVDETLGKKGGTITGEDEASYETIRYGKSNKKEIKMTPNEGFKIGKITVNGEVISFEPAEDGTFTIGENYFTNVQENKHVVVTFALAEQILTINKVDVDTQQPLQGVKFKVESATTPNELLGKLTNNGECYFEDVEGKLIPNNQNNYGGPNANSYIPIDLRNKDESEEYYVVVNASSLAGTMVAQVSEDTAPITSFSYYSTDVFMNINGGSTQNLNYTSKVLKGGKMYYLKLASTPWSTGSPYDSEVNSVRLFKKSEDKSSIMGALTSNNTTRTFEKSGDKIELTSGTQGTEGANAYVEIDLTNKPGTYNVILDTKATLSGGSYFKASITDSTDAVNDYSQYKQFVYVNTNAQGKYVSEPLEGGKKYYLQLSYTGGNPNNEVVINNICLAKSNLEEFFYNNYGEESIIIDENKYLGKLIENPTSSSDKGFILDNGKYVNEANNPSSAYVEVDLSNKKGKYNVLVDVETQNSSPMIATITTSKAPVTDGTPYGHFVYISGTNEMSTYSSNVLEGGQKYYIQFRYMGGSNPRIAKIGKIQLVESDSFETFDNAGTGAMGQVTNNGDYYFEYVNGKLVANNNNQQDDDIDPKNANSYIPIDLGTKQGKYAVVIKSRSKFPTMIATVVENKGEETDTEAITNIGGNYWTNNVFMWLNGSSISNGVSTDYTYVSKPLDGGKSYYLKLASTSRKEGEDYEASIDSIEIIKYTDVETFKNNKGDKFTAENLVTDANGQIKITVPHIGRYVITETEVPEGYTLLKTPITTMVTSSGNNTVKIDNKSKQKVLVHHYFKNSDGEYTEVKVADDEETLYDVGTNYTTAPKIDLKNLELEKNEDGTYKVPENASGIVGDTGNVITYYYQEKTIELNIHHYLEGTEEKLAPDEKIEYNPTVSIKDDEVVDVSTRQTYGVLNNNNYRTLLSRNYSMTTITQDENLVAVGDDVEKEEVSFNNNSELVYTYDMLAGKVIAKYVDQTTGSEIAERVITEDLVGRSYQVEQKEIDGYTFIKRDGNLTGTYKEEDTVVTFYYKKNAKVTVNHIDKLEETLLDKEEIIGVAGDEFTSTSKNFAKYILVEKPENETVTMTTDEIVLNYYYIKVNAGVLEKHIDIVSDEILFNELHEGDYQQEYNIEPKTFEGYDLVEDRLPENSEGQMGIDTIEVDYYYIAKTKVTVEYVNKLTGEKLTEDVIKNGHEGDNYTTESKTFEGYDLVKVPENAEGQMTKQDIVVTYEYKEKSAGVIEKHIDVKSNEVLDQKTYQGYVGDNYVVTSKEFEGYDLVENRLPENSEGQMTKALIEVDYYYIAKTKVTVEYVNKLTGTKLTEDVIKNGHEGDNYTTENKTFEGYDLVKVPENAKGEMTKQDIVVTYEYKEKSAGVIEKHIDVKSNVVLDTKTYEGHVGDSYRAASKTIEGYDLVEDRLPENSEGQMTKALIEVDYYYIAKTKVTVEYVNKLTGSKLTEDVTKNGHEGDNYTTENKTFEGYDLVKVPENASGQMTKQDIVVIYEYKEKSAGVIEKHIDILTNVVLDQKTYQGHVGDSYKTTAKQFTEYNLVEDRLPANAEGQMTKALIEVNYYYERKQGIVNVEYLEYGTNTLIKDSEVKKDRIGQSYTIEVPTINGYTYVEKNGDLQGEIGLNPKTVKLYYKQNTKVIVNYIDKNTNNVMATTTKDGLVGDEFTSNSRTFEKYILVEKPENETVIMTKDPITLNYYYIKVSASVLEKHIDVISNEVLAQELHEGNYGEQYNIKARIIAGYDLVEDRLPTNAKGTLGIDLIEVDYYYKKKAKVTVRLVDKITGEDIETPQELNLHQGDEYTVTVKNIVGYDLVEKPQGDKITINEDTNIVYYYKKKAKVETRYIDKDTGKDLLDSVVIEGHEGDNYTTEAKQIKNYNLLGTPQNNKGKMSVTVTENAGVKVFNNTTNVTYYYELAKGKVNVEYLEYGTGRKLLEKATKEDKLGKAYSVEIPAIEGFTFVEKTGDLTGKFEETEKTVKLYYKQNAQVTVNHIDKQTNKVMATNTYNGLVGDKFTSTSKNFTRYVLVEKPNNETVTMAKDPIILNYYYSKVSGGVIEKHIDVINNEILANQVHSGDNGDEYDIKARTFTNYDLVEERLPVNAKGTMGVQPIEVIYYYVSKAKVIVEYVNQLTGISLIDNIIKQGHEGEVYTTENKLFEGYKLVKVPTNANGKMTKENIIVRYEYKEESAGVIEKHIDVITNKPLDQKIYQGYVGDSYKTSSKTFAGYDLMEDRLPKNSEGKMTKDAIEVDYYYKKKAKVIVRLVDKITGKDIEVPQELDLHQGDEYKVTVKEIEGYDIFEKPEGDKVIINNDTTIIYYYKKKAKVETRYVDKATGKDLLDPVVIEGHEGDTYETEAKEIKYYKLVETPKNSKGTMHVETLENNGKTMFNDKTNVIYYYKAEDFNLKVDKNITKVILDGETLKVSNGKLAKADVHRKKLNSSSITVEYTLKVSNIGELAGGTTLKENIPEGFTFKEEKDSPWKLENGVVVLKVEELKPGEEKEFKVTLEWNKGEQNLGTKVNTASITDETNEAKFEDSNKDDNESSATIIISIATGREELLATILIITILTIGISTVIVSKKRSKKQ